MVFITSKSARTLTLTRIENMPHAINATILGYILTITALVLNCAFYDRVGVLCAVLALTCAYFHSRMYAVGTNYPKLARPIEWAAIVFVFLSYAIWLF